MAGRWTWWCAARQITVRHYTLNSTPHTLHPKLYTLHSTPYTLHPALYTQHPTPYTLQDQPAECDPENILGRFPELLLHLQVYLTECIY